MDSEFRISITNASGRQLWTAAIPTDYNHVRLGLPEAGYEEAIEIKLPEVARVQLSKGDLNDLEFFRDTVADLRARDAAISEQGVA